jgi:hypothetical protein
MPVLPQRIERFVRHRTDQTESRRALADPLTMHLLFAFSPVIVFPQVVRKVGGSVPNDSDRNHALHHGSNAVRLNGSRLPILR